MGVKFVKLGGKAVAQFVFFSILYRWLTNRIHIQSTDTDASDNGDLRKKKIKSYYNSCWFKFDSRILKPILTHSGPLLSDTLPRCCLPLADWLTTLDQREAAMAQYYSNNNGQQGDVLYGTGGNASDRAIPTDMLTPASLKDQVELRRSLERILNSEGSRPTLYSSLAPNCIPLLPSGQVKADPANGTATFTRPKDDNEVSSFPPKTQDPNDDAARL